MRSIFVILSLILSFTSYSHEPETGESKRIKRIKQLNDAAYKLYLHKGTEWVNFLLDYGHHDRKGIDVLVKEQKVKVIVDPGMTGGVIESCHFESDNKEIESKLPTLMESVPDNLPNNFVMNVSPFINNNCYLENQYTLSIIRSSGMQKYVFSQPEQCSESIPDWLGNIVKELDFEFQKYKDCAMEPNKVKNENASKAGTDAQEDARPF